jgi:vitamin B12 transporter
MRRRLSFCLLSFCLLLSWGLGPPASAEMPGTLVGTVHTTDGLPVPQVVITLRGPTPVRLVTGPEGRFRAEALASGEYSVEVDGPGFRLASGAKASVSSGPNRVELILAPAPISEQVVVTATRTDVPLSSLGAAATALDADRIAARAAPDVLTAMEAVPGLAWSRTGGIGAQASVFVRGGESRYAKILVDGVAMNEPGGGLNLGTMLPLELDRVEIVRGAASALYGTDALAGVIQMVTRRAASGPPSLSLEIEGGGFDWRRGQAGTAGRSGRFDWNLGLLRLETANEQPNSAFEQTAGAGALGARLGDSVSLRLGLRASGGTTGTPGPTAFGRPDLDESYERGDLAAGLTARYSRSATAHELRFGLAATDQLTRDPIDSGAYVPASGEQLGPFPVSDLPNPDGYQNDTRRLSAGYRGEVQASRRHLLTVGGELERETGELGDRRGDLLAPERTNLGGFVQDQLVLGPAFVMAGLRVERNGSFGTRAVPRLSLAWRLRRGEDATTARMSAGAGIKEPTFVESFSVNAFFRGNPDLKPERSRTFDLGLEQRLLAGRLRAQATLFHHDYRDQIAYALTDASTFEGTFVNVGKTRARGLEVAVEAAPTARLRVEAQYTLLDGEVVTSTTAYDPLLAPGKPLLRRPRHQGTFSARYAGDRLSGGAYLVLVGARADSDFLGLGLEDNPGYARVDLRARVRIGHGLEAYASIDNAMDAEYQEVLGYPALGRTARLGLRLRTGEARR